MTKLLTIVLALFILTAAGCVHTPYGTMRTGDWKYVQSLPPEEQAIAGPIYVREFREARRRGSQSIEDGTNRMNFSGFGSMGPMYVPPPPPYISPYTRHYHYYR